MTAMFDFIRGVFKKEDNSTASIRIGEVPGILDQYEEELDSGIRSGTCGHMEKIVDAQESLIDLVETLSSAQGEEAFHPKLEKIAKNTLPLFKKSMLAALKRDLPDSPEDFYWAATECLKGCVKSQAGPGRYLQGVFPDEMKAIRAMIDTFGREINSMTPVISETRKKRELIKRGRKTFRDLEECIQEKEYSEREVPRIEEDISREEAASEKISAELSRMIEFGEAESLHDLSKRQEMSRRELAEIERRMRSVFSNISHVFRKGEKIMQKGESGKAPKEMHVSIELLSGRDIPPGGELEKNMDPVLAVIDSMIASGDITLKNKEEKALFSDPRAITRSISELYKEREEAQERLFLAEEEYRTDPTRIRIHHLEGEIEEKKRKIYEYEEGRETLLEAAQRAESTIPELSLELEKVLGQLMDREIVLEDITGGTE